MTTTASRSALLAACLSTMAFVAAPASAQVRAAIPGASRPGGTTPMQRSMAPQTPMHRSQPGRPSGGFVGGGFGTNTGVIIGGSGLFVQGTYTSDNFNLGVNLGAHPIAPSDNVPPGTPGNCWWWGNKYCGYPTLYYPWNYPWGYYGYDYYDGYYDNSNQRYNVIDGALMVPISVQAPAQAAPVQPSPPPTDAEVAAALLRDGNPGAAADKFQAYLRDNPGDADAMRSLAVALLLKKEPDQGVAMMSLAYRTDPALAGQALPAADLFASKGDLRETLQKAVAFANKAKSASSWLTVAVIMQAQGRDDHAMRMINRAGDLGLDPALVKRFRTSLGD
jgi:hypothetical protein